MSDRRSSRGVEGRIEEPRQLPDIILRPNFYKTAPTELYGVAVHVRDNDYPVIETELGEVDPLEFLDWLLGKEVFTSVPSRGEFDTLLKVLNSTQLRELVVYGETSFKGVSVRAFGRDGNLVVRRGRKWGRLSNIVRLRSDLQTPKHMRLAAELTTLKLARHGFPELCVRSAGQIIQDIVLRSGALQPRPPELHLHRFLQAFKAARMEGVVFGRSEVYDYDIASAYPSMMSELHSTWDIQWVDSPHLIEDAVYAAVRCDVDVNPRLVRGPIAVRYGDRSIYFPVGLLVGVWLNKPEVDLLLEYPEVGKIKRVYEGSWGVSTTPSYPFRRLMRKLYSIRRSDEFLSGFMKFVMSALWGKFISSYLVRTPDSEYTQAPCLYNPVFAGHVTSEMRCNLFRRSAGREVIGEFVDGLSVDRPMVESSGFGGFVEQGRGEMVLFSDQYKGSYWKNQDLVEIARSQADSRFLEIPYTIRNSLESAYRYGGPSGVYYQLGREVQFVQRVKLGSSMRFLDRELVVGDLLEGSFRSYPPSFEDIRSLRFLRALES